MNDFKKAQHIINILTDNNYLPGSCEVIKVELNEDNNINIVFTYYDCEECENFIVPMEIWKLNSDKIIESYIDLLVAAEEEQNKRSFYEIIPKSCQNYLDDLEWEIDDGGRYSNCDEDTLWYKAQLELIRKIKNHKI